MALSGIAEQQADDGWTRSGNFGSFTDLLVCNTALLYSLVYSSRGGKFKG